MKLRAHSTQKVISWKKWLDKKHRKKIIGKKIQLKSGGKQ